MKSRTRKKHGGLWRTIAYVLGAPMYLLSHLIPRRDDLWLFGSSQGEAFADNAKYLFLYASRNLKDISCVFLSRDPDVVARLRAAGYDARGTHSLSGIWALLRSGRRFISHSTHDLQALLVGPGGTTQLWHGTPLKKIAYDARRRPTTFAGRAKASIRSLIMKLFPYLNTTMRFDRIVIASSNLTACYRSAFRIGDSKIVALGQPRNDCLDPSYELDGNLFPECDYLDRLRDQNRTIITWMPTHRLISGQSTADVFAAEPAQIDRLGEMLAAHSARLIIKVHPLDRHGLNFLADRVEQAELYEYADPYPLLRNTDVLITDYSSVYFDFLLLDRPILFTPFDRDEYEQQDAGFYFDYDDVTPGPRCADWDDFLNTLERTLQQVQRGEGDPWQARRHEICERFNDYRFGNCERVCRSFLH